MNPRDLIGEKAREDVFGALACALDEVMDRYRVSKDDFVTYRFAGDIPLKYAKQDEQGPARSVVIISMNVERMLEEGVTLKSLADGIVERKVSDRFSWCKYEEEEQRRIADKIPGADADIMTYRLIDGYNVEGLLFFGLAHPTSGYDGHFTFMSDTVPKTLENVDAFYVEWLARAMQTFGME